MAVARGRHGDGTGASLRVEVLGPLRLVVDGEEVDVPGSRRRAVLAMLALAGGRAVSVDELLDAVWPDGMPDSGRRALHSHVSRLRGHLGPCADRLRRDGDAYRLVLNEGELDVAEARAADPADALACWRGTALEEFADVAPLAAEAAALAELRLELTDRWLEARLDTGGDPELVADATRAVAAAPLRERTTVALVRALAGDGRQAEAMRAAHDFRRRLADGTGFDPGPSLDAVERAVASGALARTGEPPATATTTAPATPLVGREVELDQLRNRLAEGRLVTLVGTGGVGKTRLAVEVAAEHADAIIADLSAATDEQSAVDALAAAAGVQTPTEADRLDATTAVLAGRSVLVVLDNAEHLLDAARHLAGAALAAGAGVRLLVTSREPLGLPAEHLLRLGPLPVPDADADPRSAPAFAAFVAHARRRLPGYEPAGDEAAAVAEIVRRLDGLPLAVELAAGRVGSLAVTDLRDRLGRALDVLAGAGRRHGTLRSTIDWSYRLLSGDEQRLLRAVSAFPGGFDLDAAEHVAASLGLATDAAAALARLVDASVVVADVSGASIRYRLLETIRAFAADAVDAGGERAAVDAALVRWAVAVATAVGADSVGPREADAHRRLRTETPNLAAARERASLDERAAIALALDELPTFSGHPELAAWAVELAGDDGIRDHPARAKLLGLGATGAWLRGDLPAAERFAGEALAAALTGDERHRPLAALATVSLFRSELDLARERYEASAAAGGPSTSLGTAALAAAYAGDVAAAVDLLARAKAGAEQVRSPGQRAWAAYVEGELLAPSDPAAAVERYLAAIELARAAGAAFIEGTASLGIVATWTRQGDVVQALEGFRWLVDHWRRGGHWVQLWTTLRNLAVTLAACEDAEGALFLLAAADRAIEAAVLGGAAVATHAELEDRLVTELGDDHAAAVRARADAADRATVVEAALASVEAALAGR